MTGNVGCSEASCCCREGDFSATSNHSAIVPDATECKLVNSVLICRLRWRMLVCACTLSLGTHYSRHLLGPLKGELASQIGANESDFAALISASELVNTISPLCGFLVPKIGVGRSAALATVVVALGQAIVWLAHGYYSIGGMVTGLLLLGTGISPLAVVQESIIVQHVAISETDRRGITLALGLLVGKAATFASSITAYPLSQHFGPHSPFLVAFILGSISVVSSLVYLRDERKLAQACCLSQTYDEPVRTVSLKQAARLGDAFYAYLIICVVGGGVIYPFVHLSPHFLKGLFDTSSHASALFASIILFAPLIIYPLVGQWADRATPQKLIGLLALSFTLILATLLILASPIRFYLGPVVSLLPFTLGHGYLPLMLVIIVPRIVSNRYLSTALGLHKSLEMAGASLIQTLCGVILGRKIDEIKTPGRHVLRAIPGVLALLTSLCVIVLLACLALSWSTRRQERIRLSDEDRPLLIDCAARVDEREGKLPGKGAEVVRGWVGLGLSLVIVALSWAAFLHGRIASTT